jgi:hypothetical protein
LDAVDRRLEPLDTPAVTKRPWYLNLWSFGRNTKEMTVAAVAYLVSGVFWVTDAIVGERGDPLRLAKAIPAAVFVFFGITLLAAACRLRAERTTSD